MLEKFARTIDLWRSHENYLGGNSIELQDFNVLEYMAGLFCPGPYFYYIIDSPTLTLDLYSESVIGLLDMPRDASFNFEHWLECVHPDDLNYFYRCEDVVAWFLKQCIQPEDIIHYKITYCVRLRVREGSYHLFLLQTKTLKTTQEGALLKVFGVQTDIHHISATNNRRLSFVGLNGRRSWLDIDVFDTSLLKGFTPYPLLDHKPRFTRRELDVIRLVGAGKTTAEIAEALHISIQTVNTHRKNILRKSSMNTLTEVVVESIRCGYI